MEDLPPGTVVVFRARTREELIFRGGAGPARGRDGGFGSGMSWVGAPTPDPVRLFTAEGLTELVPDIRARDVYCKAEAEISRGGSSRCWPSFAGVPVKQIHSDQFELWRQSMRRVVLAVAGSAVAVLMLIGIKGTRVPARRLGTRPAAGRSARGRPAGRRSDRAGCRCRPGPTR